MFENNQNGFGSLRLPPISHFGSSYVNILNSDLPKNFETNYQASKGDRNSVSNQFNSYNDEIFTDGSIHEHIDTTSYEPTGFDISKTKTKFENYDDLFKLLEESEQDSQVVSVLPAKTSDNVNLFVSTVGNYRQLDNPVVASNINTFNIDLRPQTQEKLIPVNPTNYKEKDSSIFSNIGDDYLQLDPFIKPSKDNKYDIDLAAQSKLRRPFKRDINFSGKSKVLEKQLANLPTSPPPNIIDMTKRVRCIDIIYSKGIHELLKVMPRDTYIWREENEAGKIQLKRRVFVMEGDLYTYDDGRKCKLYEKLFGHFLTQVTTENGEILYLKYIRL